MSFTESLLNDRGYADWVKDLCVVEECHRFDRGVIVSPGSGGNGAGIEAGIGL